MSKPTRVTGLAVVVVLLMGTVMCLRGCARNRDALAKYKAELRAKGEKLSPEELGYPRPAEKSEGLDRLLAAANKIAGVRFPASGLDLGSHSGPGQVKLVWTSPQPVTHDKVAAYDWETITAQFTNRLSITMELREAVRTPPRYFFNDPTNFANRPTMPFVGMRNAAQWLGGDAVVALHAGRVDDAALDVQALARLAQFHQEDHTLVSQMIRVAITGLGLSVTWQALQAEGWNEEALAGLQKEWESVNLADSFETGMVGERAFGEAMLATMRAASLSERTRFLRLSTAANPTNPGSPKTVKEYFVAYVALPYWAANADADEMFFLQHLQGTLESIRELRTGAAWPAVNAGLSSNHAVLSNIFNSPMAKYRYLFSAMAIPNFLKAAATSVRNETHRRLTVTAIALERYKVRSGKYPANLDALVPQFLSAVPLDLMSAKPLCYRLNPDGTFTLYSVSEDGRDDGGDANSGAVTNRFDLWTGRDAVWPVAARQK